jgi:hypothetical protein
MSEVNWVAIANSLILDKSVVRLKCLDRRSSSFFEARSVRVNEMLRMSCGLRRITCRHTFVRPAFVGMDLRLVL